MCSRCNAVGVVRLIARGLASESEDYPGSFAISENNAVGVVPFIPRYFIAAFHEEKAQHLRR